MKEVKIKAVRSDGREFYYTGPDWKVPSDGLTGIDFTPIQIYTVNRGSGNGAIVTGKRKEARDIGIVALNQVLSNNELNRRSAIAFHNSNYTFDLHITYMGTTRVAKNCELQGAKCPSANVYARQKLTVSFLAPDSDLFASNEEKTQFKDTDALWHVERVYTENGGTLAFGLITHSNTKYVEYLGSEETPVKVTVEAGGHVENINITVGDVTIEVTCELSSGDVLIVDSDTKLVTLNGTKMSESLYNAINLPNLLMKFGDNAITVAADDQGNTAFDAELDFTGRYGGL